MGKVEIEISDYLTEEEIKEECKSAIHACIFQTYQGEQNIQRLLTNLSYYEVFKMVDEQVDGDLEKIIKRNTTRIINDLSAYSVFRDKDPISPKSKAREILDSVVKDSRPLIEGRVNEIIKDYDFKELKNEIADTVYDCISRKLSDSHEE